MAGHLFRNSRFDGGCDSDLGRARLTRKGDVDVVDFLEVIGSWGPCE
jgi:hypothetical protein